MSIQLGCVKLRSALEQARNSINAPGVIAGFVLNTQSPTMVAVGIGDVESQRVLSVTDQLRVGSLTKTFTATAMLQLVKAGALRLSDPISRWITTAVPYADLITIEHLLRHTSGLFNYTDSPAFWAEVQSTDKPKAWEPEELLKFASENNPYFSPGEGWSYSNSNYILLGLVIQEIAQQPLADVFQQEIFGPLEMIDTFLAGDQSSTKSLTLGYAVHPEDSAHFIDVSNVMPMSAAWAAGSIVSTAEDLLKFNQALFGERILEPTLLRRMKYFVTVADPVYPMVNGYGLGLVSMQIAGKTCWGHIGNIPGYSSLLAYLPQDEVHLVVLLNQNYMPPENDKNNVEIIAEAILESLFV